MDVKKKIAGSAFGILALAGIGAGVANAATTTAPPPASPSSSSSAVDTPAPGDTPDAPGAVNGGNTQQGDQTTPDAGGAAKAPEAGEQADGPGGSQVDAPGGPNNNVQQGDQSTPDVAGAPAGN